MIFVEPNPLTHGSPAQISHDAEQTLTITITSQSGEEVRIPVPPGQKVSWTPPDNWSEATFSAPGQTSVQRQIQ